MKVDQRFDGQVSIVIGSSLEREQRVNIDSPNLYTLLSGVVGVDVGASAGVNHLTRIAGVGLGETEWYPNIGLQLSSRGRTANEVGQVSKYSL